MTPWLVANQKFIAIIQQGLPLRLGFGVPTKDDPHNFLFNEKEIKTPHFPKFLTVRKFMVDL